VSGFHYFIEKPSLTPPLAEHVTAKDLAAVGVAHLTEPSGLKLRIGKHAHVIASPQTGPGGKPGCVLTVKRSDAPDPRFLQYHADAQTWLSVDGQWIGWTTDDPPQPVEVLREKPVGSVSVTDESDRQWTIPIARMPASEFGELATYYSLDRQGRTAAKLQAFEANLWQAACTLAPRLLDGETLTIAEAIPFVMLGLGRNYRVSALELAAFEAMQTPVLTGEFITTAAMVLCHYDLIAAVQKKTTGLP
jgi:hypothetical protein